MENTASNSELKKFKEAIVDLYLAIKIRSTEELDDISEGNLEKEKKKLLKKTDCFQVIEYIRSSIEIIMNLKVEDLERDLLTRGQPNEDLMMGDSESSINSFSSRSVNPNSFVMASMKEALAAASSVKQINKKQFNPKGATIQGGGLLQELNDSLNQRCGNKEQLPQEYEKLLQKMESDIRGHIRLEHEMKIHLDYLEGKVEELENATLKLTVDKKQTSKKLMTLEDSYKQVKIDTQKELEDAKLQKSILQDKFDSMDRKYKEQIERQNREIELYRLQLTSGDFPTDTLPYAPQQQSEQNVYQVMPQQIADGGKQSSSFQVQSRNNSNTHHSFSMQNSNSLQQSDLTKKGGQYLQLQYGGVLPATSSGTISINSTKKPSQAVQRSQLHESSKERLNDNKQTHQMKGINPYILDVLASTKKAFKKKSESIDLSQQKGSNLTVAQAAAKILRNSQLFGGLISGGSQQQHNNSLLANHADDSRPDEHQTYHHNKALSNNNNYDQYNNPSSYSRNTLDNQRFQGSQQQQTYKVKIDNANNNTISILSNNFVIPDASSQQQTIQQYAQQPLIKQKKKNQSSIRNSIDMNYSAITKSHSISRPLSQLAKQQQLGATSSLQIGKQSQQKSHGKLRTGNSYLQNPLAQFFELTNAGGNSHNATAAVDQLIQAQLRDRQKKLNQTSQQQQQYNTSTYNSGGGMPPGIQPSNGRDFYNQFGLR